MPSTQSRPAARWSGWSRYRFHGSWPRTTEGRSRRITSATRPRSSVPVPSSPSTSPRKTTSPVAPSAAAAARCSSCRLLDQRGLVDVGVPGALRAVGQHEVVDDRAGARPLGERGTALELGVVGVGDDHERSSGVGQVERVAPRSRRSTLEHAVDDEREVARGGSGRQVVGFVDVPAEVLRPRGPAPVRPRRSTSARWRVERPVAVGELEAGVRSATTPRWCPAADGRPRARPRPRPRRRARTGPRANGRSAWITTRPSHAAGRHASIAAWTAPLSPRPGVHMICAPTGGPRRDVVVLADHDDRERRRGHHHEVGHRSGQLGADLGVEHRREPLLRPGERLDGDEHRGRRSGPSVGSGGTSPGRRAGARHVIDVVGCWPC